MLIFPSLCILQFDDGFHGAVHNTELSQQLLVTAFKIEMMQK